jgi:hypothetical protein
MSKMDKPYVSKATGVKTQTYHISPGVWGSSMYHVSVPKATDIKTKTYHISPEPAEILLGFFRYPNQFENAWTFAPILSLKYPK